MSCVSCLLVAVALVALVAWGLRSPTPPLEDDAMTLDEYLDDACRTGDLVFFRNAGMGAVRAWVSPVSHVAMLALHPDTGEPWLVEMLEAGTLPGQRGDGVFWCPARPRLRAFDGRLAVVPVARAVEYSSVARAVRGLEGEGYPGSKVARALTCRATAGLLAHPPGMLCSEFVARVCAEAGLSDGRWRCGRWRCVLPCDLLRAAPGWRGYGDGYWLARGVTT